MIQFVSALFSGISQGVPIFLFAAGLTLIFGTMRILNFAHGGLFMVAAYVTSSVIGSSVPALPKYVVALAAGAGVAALAGTLSEVAVFRRLYRRDNIQMLIASYALLLLIQGAVSQIWGLNTRSTSSPHSIAGSFTVLRVVVVSYNVVLLAVGLAVALLLWLLLSRTRLGRAMRAVAADESMARAVGLRSRWIQLAAFAIGSLLAGVAGAFLAPSQPISDGLGTTYIISAFAAIIIGGAGSVIGALVGALVLGIAESMAANYAPSLSGFAAYIGVAVILAWKPQGLFGAGRVQEEHASRLIAERIFRSPRITRTYDSVLSLLVIPVVAVLGGLLGRYFLSDSVLSLATTAVIYILLAQSAAILFGWVGLPSFGQAAFFGVGAYAAGLLRTADLASPIVILIALVIGSVLALCFAVFGLRASGMEFAILSLVFGQILWLLTYRIGSLQGDAGIVGVIPHGFLGLSLLSVTNFWWYCIAIVAVVLVVLEILRKSQFGAVLRASREDPIRAESLGFHVRTVRSVAFAVSGGCAAVSGALFAQQGAIVTPGDVFWTVSGIAIVMCLIGGLRHFWGPAIGALVYVWISWLATEHGGNFPPELYSGAILLLIVLFLPDGATSLPVAVRRITGRLVGSGSR